jgi:hypothetical protein
MATLLSFAMQSPGLFAALLADAQYWHDAKSQRPQSYLQKDARTPMRPSRKVLSYRKEAIIHVQRKVDMLVEQPSIMPDESLLATIAYLMATEVRLFDLDLRGVMSGIPANGSLMHDRIMRVKTMPTASTPRHYDTWSR